MAASTLVVTGTDTDVGKTVVASALLRMARDRGLRAVGFKPVASGDIATGAGWENPDVKALQAASGLALPDHQVNPYRFNPAIAPHIAARRAGVTISLTHLAECHRALSAQADLVVLEGAGGWLVPLNEDVSFGGWVAQQGWPVLLVVGLRLGCINHALLTIEAIRRRAPLVGWVANGLQHPMPELDANLESLRARIDVPCWGVIAPGGADAAPRMLSAEAFSDFLHAPPEGDFSPAA